MRFQDTKALRSHDLKLSTAKGLPYHDFGAYALLGSKWPEVRPTSTLQRLK